MKNMMRLQKNNKYKIKKGSRETVNINNRKVLEKQ